MTVNFIADLQADPPEFQSAGGFLQYRILGSGNPWTNLVPLSDLQGLPGVNAVANDTATAGYVSTAGVSATKTALLALLQRRESSSINVKDYGLKGDGTVEDITALNAAIVAVSGSVEVFWPTPQTYYNLQTPLAIRDNMSMRGTNGAGPATSGKCEIRVTSGNMFNLTGLIHWFVLEDLHLSTSAGHIFNLGTAGYLAYSHFQNFSMTTLADAASMFYGRGACGYQQIIMDGFVDLRRPSTATVPAFDLQTTAGSFNCNTWSNVMASSGDGGTTPFWKMAQTGPGSYMYDNTFKDIVGEQNPGGLIELGSPLGLTMINVVDWDIATTYTNDIIKITTTSLQPGNLSFSNVGHRSGSLGAFFDINVVNPAFGLFFDRIGDINGLAKIKTHANAGNGSRRDAWGGSSVMLTINTSLPLNDTYGTVIFIGASLTATLPDPTLTYAGRRFTIKNIHSSALTVNSAGTSKTIDGAASQSLAQWGKGTYMSDGTQWITV